jgi:hypothetical protein
LPHQTNQRLLELHHHSAQTRATRFVEELMTTNAT